jgi:hypothetical protein
VLAEFSKKWAYWLVGYSGHDDEIVAYGLEVVRKRQIPAPMHQSPKMR